MTYEDAKKEIAIKHKLGMALVTGHKASYFEEAALLYADQFKIKNLAQPDVSRQVCVVMNCGKEICKKSRIYCQEHEDDIY